MDESMAEWWRRGGSIWEGSEDGRSLRVELPSEGWKLGRTAITVYAPISTARAAEIKEFYQELGELLRDEWRRSVLTTGGDWYAQVGPAQPSVG